MDSGVDTFRSRLDLIHWEDFRQWNGGNLIGGVLVGGEPRFAGRHFLGGDGFLWGHGEATNCMTDPNPEHLELLLPPTAVSIAPMQAAFTKRQQLAGALAHVYGRIDGQAVCDRIFASLTAGEFVLPSTGRVLVWLNVDPTAPLSGDYWAGWADRVNNYANFTVLPGGPAVLQPFRAAVQCRFQRDGSGKLRPDPQIQAALTAARTSWPGGNTKSHGCWADAPTVDPPDWTAFAGGPTPLIWKISRGFSQGGSQPDDHFDVDVANPGGTVAKATDFMLIAQQWQPNVPSLKNFGIINQDPVTATQITAAHAASIPKMKDTGGHYSIEKQAVHFIGRYLQPSLAQPNVVTRAEVEDLSRTPLDTFTIWEDRSAIPAYQNINYFDPAAAAGTFDGEHAFAYCGDVLRQPPHTPVFFTIDNFDPAAGTSVQVAQAKNWITQYVAMLKQARDDYVVQNPDRPYLVGLYANGEVLHWCYEAGDLDMFWQSGSPGTTGNTLPGEFSWVTDPKANRPWYHANRWQFNVDSNLAAAGWTGRPSRRP